MKGASSPVEVTEAISKEAERLPQRPLLHSLGSQNDRIIIIIIAAIIEQFPLATCQVPHKMVYILLS